MITKVVSTLAVVVSLKTLGKTIQRSLMTLKVWLEYANIVIDYHNEIGTGKTLVLFYHGHHNEKSITESSLRNN